MANAIFSSLPTTVFEEMSGLARANGAVNLGQGFPDDPGPEAVRAKAAEAVLNGYNQYPPMAGLPELRQAVAAHYGRHQALDLDWASEVTVTSGATEALAASFLALIEPGDEVIVFQPFYDAYPPLIRRAGGVPKLVRLAPPHWRFTREMLKAVFTPRTRLVVLNNPINPTGVVLPDEDLALLAEFCVAHDAIAICDEVWEQVVFGGARHRPLIAYAGMRERTVKIGSAGKMFGLTGWKVGYLCAAPALTHSLARAHQFLTFTTPPNLQSAVAWGLENSGDWFRDMPRGLERSRDRLTEGLKREGFAVIPSQGTYFLNIDLTGSGVTEGDRDFCLRAVKEAGVAAIPISAFYEADPVTTIARLCFSKGDATLDEGVTRLAKARELSLKAATPAREPAR
ncbi:MAG: aminotransferase [Alphaproteobacteria bacterium]|nr:aminotransferase [Alphaproteobacteria bacterium]MBU1512581.1 aminotransferase [Alphaproteobacteria bacterium]MBU2092920.1 aminotransferase [Alphaproteobacteria bacterium]MBU2150841.1 aminotransferase [Alphaproteobacteria bacterium]MBU2362378.1 aminotransferase [Alphaproteobacteria bacterium]